MFYLINTQMITNLLTFGFFIGAIFGDSVGKQQCGFRGVSGLMLTCFEEIGLLLRSNFKIDRIFESFDVEGLFLLNSVAMSFSLDVLSLQVTGLCFGRSSDGACSLHPFEK